MFYVFSILATPSYALKENMTPHVSTVCKTPQSGDKTGVLRAKYVCEIETYLPLVQVALEETQTPLKEQAKILHELRRTIGEKYKNRTLGWLKKIIYCRNVKKYGDYLGPTHEKLSAQGKSDAQIIKSAARTGGQDLFLDNKVMLAVIDILDYVNFGPAIDAAWSWIPGQSCNLE